MNKSVVFIDDSEDLRFLMRELLKVKLKVNCLNYGQFDQVIQNKNEVLKTAVAILDVNLGTGQPSGLDIYHWLQSQSYLGKIVFLTGHAKNHPLVGEAIQCGAEVFEKPLLSNRLIDFIKPFVNTERNVYELFR